MQVSFWMSVTDFGDAAVGVPIAAIVLLVLVASGWQRGAWAWLIAVAGCASLTVLLKLAFHLAACGFDTALPTSPVFSPSGHAALSAIVYGGLAALGGRQMPAVARRVLSGVAVLWIAMIASSRVEVHAHTPVEVIAGLAVGSGALVVLMRMLGPAQSPRARVPVLAITALLSVSLILVLPGQVQEKLRLFFHSLHVWDAVCAR